MNKETVITVVKNLPDHFELDLLIEKLIFIEKIENGAEQLNNGNTFTRQQVIAKVDQWRKI